MRITVLGTAAAEAWPGLFCACNACAEARRRGGPNIRRRTSYLVNGDTLIDLGPDINWQCQAFGIDLCGIRRIVFTHSHHDHLDPVELQWRRKGYSRIAGPLDLYGNAHVFDRIRQEGRHSFEDLALRAHLLEPGVVCEADGLEILPIEAQHGADDECALNHVIRDGEAGLLVANDTGWWPDASWERVRNLELDAAIIECTYLHLDPEARRYHLGANATVAFRDRLLALRALKPDARVFTSHFSHNGATLHEELCEFFGPQRITVAFDGLTFTI